MERKRVCPTSNPVWFVTTILSLAVGSAGAADGLVLVKDGRPTATLVLAAKPRQGSQLAAAELQHYIEKMTGCRLPEATDESDVKGVRILVGESKATRTLGYTNDDFLPEESCVQTGPDYLLVVGRDHDSYGDISYEKDGVYPGFQWYHDLGTLYGVLDFLERECGVRWYLPGQIGEVVARKTTLAVGPVDRKRRPWARNRWAVPRPFPKRLYHYFTLNLTSGPLTVDQLSSERETNRWWLHMRLRNEPVSFSHQAGWFRQRFGKTHSEYFGQGWPAGKGVYAAQPAYHREEVIDEYAKEAIAHFDQPLEQRYHKSLWQRSPEYFSVSPEDNAKWCKSPEAQAKFDGPPPTWFWGGWASRYVWDFANEVARRVGKKHPDRWIGCHAYWQHQMPYEGMTIEPNLAVCFCRTLMQEWHPALRAQHEQALAAWLRLKPSRLYLYEYYLFPQHRRFNVFPGWAPHRTAEFLRHMKQIGLRGAYNDIACVRVSGRAWRDGKWTPYAWANPVLDQVNFYVWFKYLDDQNRDVDEMLDEMYEHLYGPAGKHIKEFTTLGERIYFDPSCYGDLLKQNHQHIDGRISWTMLCPPETMARFGQIMQAAHATAQTEIQKTRVQLFDDAVYQMLKTSADQWHKENLPLTAENSQPLPPKWRFMPDPKKEGRQKEWFTEGLDDSSWREVSGALHLEKQGIDSYVHGWYRTRIDVPAERQGVKIILRLGAVDETCWLWVNGQPAGELIYDAAVDTSSWRKPQFFDITSYVKVGATNQITVLVQNVSGRGGIWRPSHLVFEHQAK